MKQRILMLDIDGVLLSGRAMLLPGNEHKLTRRKVTAGQHSVRDEAMQAVFDPAAVALVNRICREAGAKIVVHSNWRKTVGEDTRAKLIEQGITEDLLHEHWATPIRAHHRDEKAAEIIGWQIEHRLTPDPGPRPRFDGAAEKDWYAAKYATGYDVVVIDDEHLGQLTAATQLVINPYEGFTVADARKVLGLWRAEDTLLGVYAVVDGDWQRVAEAFDGDRAKVVEWLHTVDRYGESRARGLAGNASRFQAEAAVWLNRPLPATEEMRQQIWAELETETANHLAALEVTATGEPDPDFGEPDGRWEIARQAARGELRWPECIDALHQAIAGEGRHFDAYYPEDLAADQLAGVRANGVEATAREMARVGRPWGLVPGLVPRRSQLEAEIQASKEDLAADRVRDAKEVAQGLRADLEQWRTEGFGDGEWEANHSPIFNDQALGDLLHDEGKRLGMWFWAPSNVARAAVVCIMDPKHAERIIRVSGPRNAAFTRYPAREEIDRLAGVEIVARNAVALMRAAGLDAALDDLRHHLGMPHFGTAQWHLVRLLVMLSWHPRNGYVLEQMDLARVGYRLGVEAGDDPGDLETAWVKARAELNGLRGLAGGEHKDCLWFSIEDALSGADSILGYR
ncbi:MAG: hypothetical protein FD176_186 [Rhodospirillaceae bacterium]|nr:MAG: hypothetical protein FD176_186 [Rhodospirillaceae bacterium]TNC98704.1 MAG: hypothetical protein FD119_175 [Stygiobacter sp.]